MLLPALAAAFDLINEGTKYDALLTLIGVAITLGVILMLTFQVLIG